MTTPLVRVDLTALTVCSTPGPAAATATQRTQGSEPLVSSPSSGHVPGTCNPLRVLQDRSWETLGHVSVPGLSQADSLAAASALVRAALDTSAFKGAIHSPGAECWVGGLQPGGGHVVPLNRWPVSDGDGEQVVVVVREAVAAAAAVKGGEGGKRRRGVDEGGDAGEEPSFCGGSVGSAAPKRVRCGVADEGGGSGPVDSNSASVKSDGSGGPGGNIGSGGGDGGVERAGGATGSDGGSHTCDTLVITGPLGQPMVLVERRMLEGQGLVQVVTEAVTAADISAGLDRWRPRGVLLSTVHVGACACAFSEVLG
jgi:hypothetical protein